jgi:hypothetical protein
MLFRFFIIIILTLLFVAGCLGFDLFVLPHSHDDLGWIRTIDEYYNHSVSKIYTTAIPAILDVNVDKSNNISRKFQSVEQGYFYMWYVLDDRISEAQRAQAREAIGSGSGSGSGSLSFTTGGWAMPDQCDIYFSDAVNGVTLGHEFILDAFGEAALPRFSFEVDPFGATRFIAMMYALMGFDAHIISRIDFREKQRRQLAKELEFVWHTAQAVDPARASIFTHIMDQYSYENPGLLVLNFDGQWGITAPPDLPPSPPVTGLTVGPLAEFVSLNANERASWFATPNLLWPYGAPDFQWPNATVMFDNFDKVMAKIQQARPAGVTSAGYAHLRDYFAAVRGFALANNVSFGSLGEASDFTPYNDLRDKTEEGYWTGYYTSRPLLKGLARSAGAALRTAEALFVALCGAGASLDRGCSERFFPSLFMLRRACGEATHHDAVAGTSTAAVTQMYVDHLNAGVAGVAPLVEAAASELVTGAKSPASLNATTAGMPAGANVTFAAFNSLGWAVRRAIRVPVGDAWSSGAFVVTSAATGLPVPCQAMPSSNGSLFIIATLPPLGHASFSVARLAAGGGKGTCSVGERAPAGTATVTSSRFVLTFDPSTGKLASVADRLNGTVTRLGMDFFTYEGCTKACPGGQASGAYVFAPVGPASRASATATLSIVAGPIVSEAALSYAGTTFSTEVRVFTDPEEADERVEGYVETESSLGPLPAANVDVVLRFDTSLATGSKFFTDSNGLMTMPRAQRTVPGPTKTVPSLNISGNYYPFVAQAFIRDAEVQITALGDRSHGFTSLEEGQFEVMMHRRSLQGDNRGPVLDDLDRVEAVSLWLVVGDPKASNALRHRLHFHQNFPPTLFFETAGSPWPQGSAPASSLLTGELPASLHLASLQARVPTPLAASTAPFPGPQTTGLLVRVVHLFEVGEDPVLSQPVKLDLSQLLGKGPGQERTLSGVWPATRYAQRWNYFLNNGQKTTKARSKAATFVMVPMDFRTFLF